MAIKTGSSIEIIQHLVLAAGAMMEDASVELAFAIPTAADDRMARLDWLRQLACDIAVLSLAAEVLTRHGKAGLPPS
jgi:hypothetical protein